MPSRIDHVILAASDLDQLEVAFTRLGFTIVGGGTHPHLGTRNRIIVLGDSYIELLAMADRAHVSPALAERIAAGAGWVGYALQSDDIAAEVQAMRERGADTHGPSSGRLIAPDGTMRGWRVVTLGSDDLWAAALPLPFLIQHDNTGELHQRELAGADLLAPHPNGAVRLVGVTLACDAPADLRRRYEHAYGLAVAVAPSASALRDDDATFPLSYGTEWIHLTRQTSAGEGLRMTARIGVRDLGDVERMAHQAGFAVAPLADALHVSLPASSAAIEFSQT